MKNLYAGMYLRPGQLKKKFTVKRNISKVINGYRKDVIEETGEEVVGILAEADTQVSERKKHLWGQEQHSITHTLVTQKATGLRKGDFLSYKERLFLVLVCDNVAAIGTASLIYLEERNDLS